jgi:16S rRNA processing protein RimM
MTTPENWTWLARIRRYQGRKGEVFADLLTDFPEKFAERKQLWLLGGNTPAKPSSAPESRPGKYKAAGQNSQASGHNSAGSRETESKPLEASGHDFSRAAHAPKLTRALAPEGSSLAAPAPREVELIAHWPHKGGIVLHFAGVDSITAAETLKGMVVAIPQTERAALDQDEVYVGDLIGCTLVDVAGAEPVTVGPIEDVDRSSGPVALLVVRGASGEVLVPFAKSYLRKIDLKAKRVEMSLPEGLVDLNAPGKNS